MGLISGIIDLDKIPTRFLVAELLIIIAHKGEEYARTNLAATGMGGILVFWEQWLWSLLPSDSQFQPQVPNNSAREALSTQLGMNGDRWFEAIILGLAVTSPPITAILEAIAAIAPTPTIQPSPPKTPVEDIIGTSQSIQR